MGEMLGRVRERAALDGVLARIRTGIGAGATIEAEAGLGKSTLLADTAERAAVQATVALAEADELEQGRPFGVLLRALGCTPRATDERRARVASLMSAGSRNDATTLLAGPAGDRFLVQDALVELAEELAADRPLVIVVDDAHWADGASLTTLGVMARHCRSLPVAIVIAARPWPRPPELDPLLERLQRLDGVALRLHGLDDATVHALAAQALGAMPGPRLTEALGAANGNPFYVRELLRYADDEGRLARAGDAVELVGDLATEPFMDRLVRRLGGLAAATRNLMRVAALYGPSFDLRDLATLVGEPVVTLEALTTDARHAGLLRATSDGRLAFAHDLVREAIVADLPATVRHALHRDIAHSLISRSAPVDVVVPHLLIGAQPGDVIATQWLESAAMEVAAVDPVRAEQLLARAQELSPPARRLRLQAERARMLKWAGRLDEASAMARDALTSKPDQGTALRLRIELAETDLLAGRTKQALGPLLTAAEEADVGRDVRAQLWSEVASSALWTLDFELCERACAQAIELADETSPTAAALAHSLLARRHGMSGDLAATTRHALVAIDLAKRYQPTARSVPMFYAGLALGWTDPGAAIDTLQDGLRRAEKQGLTWSQPVFYQGLVTAAFDAGRWDEAIAFYETGCDLQAEMSELGEPSVDAFVGLIHVGRDEIERARELLAATHEAMTLPNARYGSLLYIRWLEAHLLEHDGQRAAAGAMLLEAAEAAAQFGAPNSAITLAPEGVEWADPDTERELMERVTLIVEALAGPDCAPMQRSAALRCRAALDGRVDLLPEAVQVLVPTGRDRDLLQTCLAAGRALVAEGELAEARAVLELGVSRAERMGAMRYERELRSLLRAAGAVRGVRTARKRATVGWESLTDTELHVVRLVRDGLTNAEIGLRLLISRRTVDTHLVNVYRKLGLSSRAALAALVAERLPATRSEASR